MDWINIKLENKILNENTNFLIDRYFLLDMKLDVKKIISNSKSRYELIDEKLYVFARNEKLIENCIKKFYELKAIEVIEPIFKKIATLNSFKFKNLSFKWLKNKHGYCTRDSSIVLSYDLISYDYDVIEYVCVHELVHTVIFNHSSHFWGKVKDICSNYEQVMLKLKYEI